MRIERTIQVLCDAVVDFVVIGGVAANLHGSARVTYDLDIVYARDYENLRRLAKALLPFHPRPRGFPEGLPFLWDEKMLANTTVLTLQTDLGELDLLAEVAGLADFAEVKTGAIVIEAFGRRFHVLDLPALLVSKRSAGRKKDLEAIAELESLLEAREDKQP